MEVPMKASVDATFRAVVAAAVLSLLWGCSGKGVLEGGASDLSSQASDRDAWGETSCSTIEKAHRQEAADLASMKPEERAKAAKSLALGELARRNHCAPPVSAGCSARVLYLSSSSAAFPADVSKTMAEGRSAAGGWALVEACAPRLGQGCPEIVKAALSAPADLASVVRKAASVCFPSKP